MNIQKRNLTESLDFIAQQAREKNVAEICRPVYESERFRRWPASISHHHKEEGGLAIHTAEVLDGARHLGYAYGLDLRVLTTAAIWHDFGKTAEYERSPDGAFVVAASEKGLTARETLGHPAIAAIAVGACATLLPESFGNEGFLEHVTHCILSHHGRIEWGAIKEPQTAEAWALHAADMFSARY